MKITITRSIREVYGEPELQGISYQLETDSNEKAGAEFHELTECPEDATFGRDLSSALDLDNLIKLAYTAGKLGEEFEIIEHEEQW